MFIKSGLIFSILLIFLIFWFLTSMKKFFSYFIFKNMTISIYTRRVCWGGTAVNLANEYSILSKFYWTIKLFFSPSSSISLWMVFVIYIFLFTGPRKLTIFYSYSLTPKSLFFKKLFTINIKKLIYRTCLQLFNLSYAHFPLIRIKCVLFLVLENLFLCGRFGILRIFNVFQDISFLGNWLPLFIIYFLGQVTYVPPEFWLIK